MSWFEHYNMRPFDLSEYQYKIKVDNKARREYHGLTTTPEWGSSYLLRVCDDLGEYEDESV